jgi:hypothetical protein
MGQEYLARGFADVDGCNDATAYRRCLALLDLLPYFRGSSRPETQMKSSPPRPVLSLDASLHAATT